MSRKDRMYGNSPTLERNKESGKVERSTKKDIAVDKAGAGTDGMPEHEKHAMEMGHKHEKEHLELNQKHEKERHALRSKHMISMHEKSGSEPAGEGKNKEHEQGKTGGEKIEKVEKDKKESK